MAVATSNAWKKYDFTSVRLEYAHACCQGGEYVPGHFHVRPFDRGRRSLAFSSSHLIALQLRCLRSSTTCTSTITTAITAVRQDCARGGTETSSSQARRLAAPPELWRGFLLYRRRS